MTIEITPDIIEAIKTIIPHPGLSMKPLDRAPPTIATIRELDIVANGARIDVRYSGANRHVDLNNFNGLSDVLMRLHNGDITVNENGAPTGEYKSPLSLNNRKYCYIIMKITTKNWQFSGEEDPFTISIEHWDKKVYYEARKVYKGVEQPRGAKKNECMIAYFIADGAKVLDNEDKYSHDFNFHLDLVYKDSNTVDGYTPIIIDPDVRFPGGSGGQ